jgi:colicin import membrane protein
MATADRIDFTPPPPPGFLRGMGLALLAHALLVVALTYGLRWNRDAQPVSAEAELWSAVPQEAAPKEVAVPVPAPVPAPPPPPVVRAPPLPEPPVQPDAQIAIEREKRQREAAERKQEELERERERDKRRKLEAQQKREEALELKKQQQAKLAAEKRKKEEEAQRKEEQEAKRLAQQREENLRRMQGLAGSGSATATGSAAQSSGPSASWAGKVQAKVRPNIVYSDESPGNPKAEVEVRMAPDGTIVGRKLVKSSGVKAWDDAVLRALDKTESLPRDEGRVHSPVVIEFRPRG